MSFGGFILTNLGRRELAKAEVGETLTFNYVAIGDGSNSGAVTSLDSLSNELYQLPILAVKRNEDTVTIETELTNAELQVGFYLREIGLYANGILYAYDNAGQEAEYIDSASSAVAKSKRIRIALTVSPGAVITVKLDSGLYALQSDFLEHASNIEKHIPADGEEGQILVCGEDGAAKWEPPAEGITVDSALNSNSENPVQNKVINSALEKKVDKISGKGLSTNDYTTAEKQKLSGIADGANKTTVDSALSSTSTNPVQNKVITTEFGGIKNPTYSVASSLSALVSEELLTTAFGKISKAISTLISHVSTKATSSVLGHVKLSQSTAITTTGEYALDAIEKNASVKDTLAYQIATANKGLEERVTRCDLPSVDSSQPWLSLKEYAVDLPYNEPVIGMIGKDACYWGYINYASKKGRFVLITDNMGLYDVRCTSLTSNIWYYLKITTDSETRF